MRNRRNYYRVLHVQRDAPAALIKSCYRALMHTLEMHPDRGGDHWNAALLNEAYAVLSDESRRVEYDRTLVDPRRNSQAPPVVEVKRDSATPASDAGDGFCVFCGLPHTTYEERCAKCTSPLTMSTEWSGQASGRRAMQRLTLDREIGLYPEWPLGRPRCARIRDLSPGGLCLELDRAIELHQIIKLSSDVLQAVARVAHCKESTDDDTRRFVVGAEFFTLHLPQMKGVFLSVSG